MRAWCLSVLLASLVIGLAHSAPKAFTDEDFDDYEGNDVPQFDDVDSGDDDNDGDDGSDDGDDGDDDGDDDDGDDDDGGDDDGGDDDITRRSADFQSDNPVETGLDGVLVDPTIASPTASTIVVKNGGICPKAAGTDLKPAGSTGKGLQRSRCGKPRSPKHGSCSVNGQHVRYHCRRGYKLHGAKQNRCVRTRGRYQWSNRTPTCKRTSRR